MSQAGKGQTAHHQTCWVTRWCKHSSNIHLENSLVASLWYVLTSLTLKTTSFNYNWLNQHNNRMSVVTIWYVYGLSMPKSAVKHLRAPNTPPMACPRLLWLLIFIAWGHWCSARVCAGPVIPLRLAVVMESTGQEESELNWLILGWLNGKRDQQSHSRCDQIRRNTLKTAATANVGIFFTF